MPNRSLVKSMVDSEAEKKHVDIRAEAAPPRSDPTCGVPVSSPLGLGKSAPHRLVVIGDSMSHGFKSGAIHDTHVAWPAIVAWEMGIDRTFRRPTYHGFGGLPLNIEWMLHELESRYGERIDWWELTPAAFSVRHLMDQVEDWWERGKGSQTPGMGGIAHNLSVYGWDLRDALSYTADHAARRIAATKRGDQWLRQIVDCAQERAALRVLDSARAGGASLSPVEAALELGSHGASAPATGAGTGGTRRRSATGGGGGAIASPGIETLVVVLGANNVLGTVLSLKPKWSGTGYDDLEKKNDYNVWAPDHFAKELDLLVKALHNVNAAHVVLATVPHVTIAPVARGVGGKYEPGSRYFPYYTRPWIKDNQFNPWDDPCLTSREARAIDSAIDQYNAAIEGAVKAARAQGKHWFLLDLCGMLDRLATRRYIEDPSARPDWWTPYELPPDLARLTPAVSTTFFRSDKSGRTAGGIFSLDGVHPTTVAYGLIAQEVVNILQLAGVKFYFGDDQRVERPGRVSVDFARLLAHDTLMRNPPRSLTSTLDLLGWLDEHLGVFMGLASRK